MMDFGDVRQFLISAAFVIGGLGNVAALWILHKSVKVRNPKHVLLLRCLAANDLVAQVGMLVLLNLHQFVEIPIYWKCALYVMLRAFGLGSGCVAFVMALERWLALTRPFLYQRFITKVFLRRIIITLWLGAVLLTYSPLIGFGLFYKDGKCRRYRDATETADIVYAYLFLVFGIALCACIAVFNSQVFLALSRCGRNPKRMLIRRVSRVIITNNAQHRNFATSEELAFAKLMAFICIVFVLCWMPQLISIPLGQFMPTSKVYPVFARIADLLMCIYFTLDPFIYVIHKSIEKTKFRLTFKHQNHTEASKTTEDVQHPENSV